MALAIMMPPKGKASAEPTPQPDQNEDADNLASQTAPPHLTGRWDFSRLITVEAEPNIVGDAIESAQQVQHIAENAWRMTVKAAAKNGEAIEVIAAMQKEAAPEVATASPAAAAVSPEAHAAPDATGTFTPKPMTFEEVRLWLQSFNAGPYATLKYKGNVPYQETKNYVPRVMKYYEEVGETEYDAEIEAAAAKYGLDPQMIRAIMKTESSFNNKTVSHAGARGLMQVMPVVWKDFNKKYDLDWEYSSGVFEPEKNIEVACAYLSWLRYDFLPRHFDAYEADPQAPVVLVRDKDRGVPDRESPRIIVQAVDGIAGPAATEVVSVVEVKPKKTVIADSATGLKSKVEKAEDKSADSKKENAKSATSTESAKIEKPKIEISAANDDKVAKKSSGNGKTRVVMRGGSGKSIQISVSEKGKVASRSSSDKADKAEAKVAAHSQDDSKDRDEISMQKRKSVAKADAKETKKKEDDSQGG